MATPKTYKGIELLTGSANYFEWSMRVLAYAQAHELEYVLDQDPLQPQPSTSSQTPTTTVSRAESKYKKDAAQLRLFIFQVMDSSLVGPFFNVSSVKTIWCDLRRRFQRTDQQLGLDLYTQLVHLKWECTENFSAYITRARTLSQRCQAAGCVLAAFDLPHFILEGMKGRPTYDTTRQILQNQPGIDLDEIESRVTRIESESTTSSTGLVKSYLVHPGNPCSPSSAQALHCAASRGHSECLETLLTLCNVDVDTEDHNGCTPLFYAVTLGHADCVALLLGQGSSPNHQDRKGRTPAHCGAAKAQLETIKILEKNGADLWKTNNRGDLPLHEAVQSGRKDLVLWLLMQRPNAINASNNDGRTCLHIAAINNNVELCKVLIDNGADVNPVMKNNKGSTMTPLDAAIFKSNRGCANYLQLHGGMPAQKLNDKTMLSISYRGLETQVTPDSVTPDIDGASLGSSVQEKSIQTTIRQDSDHENNDAAPPSETMQESGRQLEKIPEEQDATPDEKKGKTKDNGSVTSEENSSPRNKDSGFSDNNRGGAHSDVDGSDVLSSPTGEITFIDNGEVVRRRRRSRKSRTTQGRNGDSESEISEKDRANEADHQAGGKTAGRRQMRFRSEPETSFFRPKSEDRSLPGVNNGRLRVHQKERRIFQELMELNRVRINADRSEEQFIVRKLSDNYRHQGLIVGNLRFMGPFTFHQYEKYLFDQLRQLSGTSAVGGPSHRLAAGGWNETTKPRTGKTAAPGNDVDDPSQCTHRTYHCHHATHTYMGVPCVAYLKPNRPPLLPKINTKPVPSKSARNFNGKQNLATVDPKQPVMLEIKHGGQIQKFSLPTEKLDKTKKYQLTFTIGPGGAAQSKVDNKTNGPILKPLRNA